MKTGHRVEGRPLGQDDLPLFGPELQIENKPRITAHPVAWVLIIGIGAMLFLAVPFGAPFLVFALLGGAVLGALLWWKHR